MVSRQDIIDKAFELGFADIGFTGIEPFSSQKDYLNNENSHYGWTEKIGLSLKESIDPSSVLENARSIIVLLHGYYTKSIPVSLLNNYGRCYLTDDRVTKDGLYLIIKAFREFLRNNNIHSRLSKSLPDKLAAARAGVGTFGKNCLLYASRSVKRSSWVVPVVIVVDREFEPDSPSVITGCPDWCRNACIASCPTRALLGGGRIDPIRCISYLTYYGEGLTPMELREPMGMYIYGCDRCQNVCPRNYAWMNSEHEEYRKLKDMAEIFRPEKILMMDKDYFKKFIWPRMFYISSSDIWRWKMNAARALGNSLERVYIPVLINALQNEDDDRVRCMSAWALGRIGGNEAADALKKMKESCSGYLLHEIEEALKKF